jgi:ADP-ribosyl-[dinitrogen reductase] hydrolase
VLWTTAIRHAILTGVLDARIGLQHIDIDRRDLWAERLDVAERSQPSDFTNNGWVVESGARCVVCNLDHPCPA